MTANTQKDSKKSVALKRKRKLKRKSMQEKRQDIEAIEYVAEAADIKVETLCGVMTEGVAFSDELELVENEGEDKPIPQLKIIKRYPRQRCRIDGCNHYAVGAVDVCKKHGGDPIVRENLVRISEMTDSHLMSKYDAAVHPMQYIECSRGGMSDVEIAADMGISMPTIKAWSETYLEFNTAYEVGKTLHEAWWLTEGKDNLDNRGYNTGMFKFLTGNKLGYSEKIESKNLHVHAGVLKVPAPMSEDEWTEKAGGK